jgi:hypothetical protein
MKLFTGEDAVHWEFSGTDANTVKTIKIFNPDGTERTMTASEVAWITSYCIVNGDTAQIVTVFVDCDGDGAVDLGERLAGGDVAISAVLQGDLSASPRKVTLADALKVLTEAAAGVTVVCHGFIRQK